MRIGIDAASWFNGRGYGRYSREVLSRLPGVGAAHEFVMFVEEQNADRLPNGHANVTHCRVACRVPPTEAAAARGNRSPGDMLRFSSAVGRAGLDAFYFPTVYSYFPVPPALPTVVTVHDAIAERFPKLTLPSRRARLFWRLKVSAAVRMSRLVATTTAYSADDVSRRLGVPRSRIRETSAAPSEAYCRDSSPEEVEAAARSVGLPEGARWFTYVGGFSPHKRVDCLVAAHARLAAASEEPPHLLLVGALDGDVFLGCRRELEETIERLGTRELVHWTGFVEDEPLRALHAGARACVLASECEGYGLPAVEAAAAGTPVVATLESPLPQVLEGGGLFVRPGDEAALEDALRTMDVDDAARGRMARTARERARALSWDTVARRVLDALEEAAS